ncbi:MAG: sigma-70 family RNA polymerase sigma factor [Prolixibacteraceae bacterium]|nr:sigma-70 family RNA polymerase sigma factor [Prolixibacteraceae bacterium]
MKTIDWSVLYYQKAPMLKGMCRRYVIDVQLAEDMVHNAFELAIANIETFKGKGSFEGWLKRIAINQCLQYLREKQKSKSKLVEYQNQKVNEMKTEKNIENRIPFSEDELLEVIDELPYQQKLVFNLYVLDGYKHHEIADLLSISEGTSKSNLSRARRKAKQVLLNRTKDKLVARNNSWFLLLFLRFKGIDSIFSNGLKTYTLSSTSTPILVAISAKATIPIFTAISYKVAIISIVFLSSIVGVVSLKKSKVSKPIQIEAELLDSIVDLSIETTIALEKMDSLVRDTTRKPAPIVVVRKQKIIRDTVYVPKTIN